MREYTSIRLKESVNIGAKEAGFFKLGDAYGTKSISRDDDGFFTIRAEVTGPSGDMTVFTIEVPQGNVRQAEPLAKQPRAFKPAAVTLRDS